MLASWLAGLMVVTTAGAPVGVRPVDAEHAAWTALLHRRGSGGEVDYAAMKKADEAALNDYLRSLAAVTREHYDAWSTNQRLAFWINAYNAFTIRLILDHYPLKSIRSIGVLPLAAFRESFISLPGLRAKPLSLNDVENEILRKEFREPRIHFSIVCASKSCPTLRPEAYRGKDLEKQLDDATRAFLADTSKNRFEEGGKRLQLSSIFKWFREDFERDGGKLQDFVGRYGPAKPAAGAAVEFLDYDWALNGR